MKTLDSREVFQRHAGTWDSAFAKFMFGPNDTPIHTKGVETNKVLEGGLWLVMDQRYEYPGGVYEGWGMFGYDPQKNKYIGSWVDTTNSHLNSSEGMYDEDTHTLTLIADGVDPTTGRLSQVKQVITHTDPDTKVFSVYKRDGDGNDIKLLEVEAHRRK